MNQRYFTWMMGVVFSLLPALSFMSAAEQLSSRSQSFTVTPGGQLELKAGSGDIRISSWEKNEVLVDVTGLEERDAQYLTMEQSGNTIRVVYEPRRGGSDVRFDARIPVKFNVKLTTAGGDISLNGSVDGTVEGTTAGGDISVGDVTSTLRLTTAGGDITGGRVGGNAELTSAGGDITLTGADGDLKVQTAGGDIRCGDVGKSLRANTAGGDIELGNVGGTADVSTAGGDIQIGSVTGSVTAKTSGGDIHLDGAAGTVVAHTAGGDLDLINVSGSIEGKTAGGDIVAELRPGGGSGSSLETAGGDILLRVPSSANATIEAVVRIQGDWEDALEDAEIISDFPSADYVEDRDRREIRATYQLNGGGERISARTVNGVIEIRRLAQ